METAAGDWRLPNLKELTSLVASECNNPSINEVLFPNTPSSSFWTSSPFVDTASDAWYISFSDGSGLEGPKSDDATIHVRLVRDRIAP